MKKISLLLLLVALFSCSLDLPTETIANENQSSESQLNNRLFSKNVTLVKYSGYTHRKYGMAQIERTFIIRAKKLNDDQKVIVHYQVKDGEWSNFDSELIEDTNDGYALYKTFAWETTYSYSVDKIGTEFVIKLSAGNQVFWDNNDGKNYNFTCDFGTYLAEDVPVYLHSAGFNTAIHGIIDLKNLGYTKNVEIVYTYDDWKTVKYAQAEYLGPIYYYGYSFSESPNKYGVERWVFGTEKIENATEAKFAIKYTVNNVTYWDNNFGNNYVFVK